MRRLRNLERDKCNYLVGALIGGAALGAGISATGGLIGSAISAKSTDTASKRAAEAQKSVNAQNIAFQREENEIARAREDTAHQREVDDLRKAGLSPLANTAGESAQAMTAPQADASGLVRSAELGGEAGAMLGNGVGNAVSTSGEKIIGNYLQLKQQQNADAFNASSIARTDAETDSINLSNALASAQYFDKISELREKVAGMKVHNEMDTMRKNRYMEYLDAELNSMASNSRNANAQASLSEQKHRFNEADAQFYEDLGIPHDTSVSLSTTTPIGYGMVTGRNLANQRDKIHKSKELNAMAVDMASSDFDDMVSRAEQEEARLKEIWQKEKGVSNRQAYDKQSAYVKSLKKHKDEWINARKQYYLSDYEDYKRDK